MLGPAISDILPLAVGVMIIPIPIIAIILILLSPKARANGIAFLAGWVVGLAAVATVAYLVASAADVGSDSDASDGASTLKVVLGVALVVMAARAWRRRPAPGQPVEMPKWMHAIDTLTPPKAVGLALVLSAANPKNLLLTVAAATTLAQAGLPGGDAAIALAVFVVIGTIAIAAPVAAVLFTGERAEPTLTTWKGWLEQNNAAVIAVVLLVMGVVVLSKGLGLLTA